MTREEAYQAMIEGKKVAHNYFSMGEYYEMKHKNSQSIIAEDGVNHTKIFWSEEDNNFRKNGWHIVKFFK